MSIFKLGLIELVRSTVFGLDDELLLSIVDRDCTLLRLRLTGTPLARLPGMVNKGIAKSFYAAGTFYEILQQFYPNKEEGDNNINEDDYSEIKEQIDEEEKRRLYCKWKATDILNAIKEGRTPIPGGFQKESESGVKESEKD